MCFGKEPLTIFDRLTQGNVPTEFKTAGTGDSAGPDTDFYLSSKNPFVIAQSLFAGATAA